VLRILDVYPGSRVDKVPDPDPHSHPHQRIQVFSTQKLFLSSQKNDQGMFISDPIFFPIPDPGVIKAPDPGSGSATLQHLTINRERLEENEAENQYTTEMKK
jgi:hypothetical protein